MGIESTSVFYGGVPPQSPRRLPELRNPKAEIEIRNKSEIRSSGKWVGSRTETASAVRSGEKVY
jgi:hypothetical protein